MERIKELIARAGIEKYTALKVNESTAELFFVKKQLDQRRIKDVEKVNVTVYREGEKDGRPMTAQSEVTLLPAMTEAECIKALEGAYYAAQFAMNPQYDLPDPVTAPEIKKTGELAEAPAEELAGRFAEALFAADCEEGAFVNSAEVFITRKRLRVISSEGTDASWTTAKASGEYVVQAKEPEDVEIYRSFAFDEPEYAALTAHVREALSFVRDRARAERAIKSGSYDLILTGENAAEVLKFYAARASAQMLYPHYSTWAVGDDVQGETNGERLDLTMRATAPYSAEGIPMKDAKLIENGRLLLIHGGNRFCRYLGVPATGDYRKLSCDNAGSLAFDEMKSRPCLWAVTFSDFQMDPLSGHFGGEIRLAYLIEDGRMTPVTGGSVNGSIMDAQRDVVFSKERFVCESYEGPYAMLLKGVSVAGE